ncbi:hypothetical protein ACA910_001440 [Epithemia clementina (nom. ined.)]
MKRYYQTKRLSWHKNSELFMIQCPAHANVTHIWPSLAAISALSSSSLSPSSSTSNTTATTTGLDDERIPIYDIRPYLICNALETTEFHKQHPSHDNGHHHHHSINNNNHYSNNNNNKRVKVGACLIVRGETSRQYLPEWIAYHSLLGVQHIWVHVNEPWTDYWQQQQQEQQEQQQPQQPPLLDQVGVTYIPYNYYLGDHLGGDQARMFLIYWQVPMQMRCLWRAKELGLDWIMTTDTDEYMDIFVEENNNNNNNNNKNDKKKNATTTAPTAMMIMADNDEDHASTSYTNYQDYSNRSKSMHKKTHTAEPLFSLSSSSSSSSLPLIHFLSRYDPHAVGALQMMSVPHGRPPRLAGGITTTTLDRNNHNNNNHSSTSTSNSNMLLQMDQTWRHKNMESGGFARCKLLYSVPNAASVGVHYLWTCGIDRGSDSDSSDKPSCTIVPLNQPQTSLFLRHYKKAPRSPTGIYHAQDHAQLVNDTRLVDRYRTQVVQVLLEKNENNNKRRNTNTQ